MATLGGSADHLKPEYKVMPPGNLPKTVNELLSMGPETVEEVVKNILDEPDCGCEHPEALHELNPVLANPRVNIRNGACRVAGCGCLFFDPNRTGPKTETLKERMERQGKGRGLAVVERMRQVSHRRLR